LSFVSYANSHIGIISEPSYFFNGLFCCSIKNGILTIYKANCSVFLLTLATSKQHTTTRHSFKILNHVFPHIHISAQEYADAVQHIDIILA